MGLVSLTAHVAGTVLTAAALNNNFNAIANQINGSIEAVNIASLAVTSAKIATGAVTGPKIAMGSDAQGDILYHNGTSYARLAAGVSGQYLKTQGAGANPTWGTLFATQTEMEAASSLIVAGSPGNMKWHPGVAKAGAQIIADGSGMNSSFGVTSVTDGGAGTYTLNWATNFSNDDYFVAGCCIGVNFMALSSIAVGSVGVKAYSDSGAAEDKITMVIAFGDFA